MICEKANPLFGKWPSMFDNIRMSRRTFRRSYFTFGSSHSSSATYKKWPPWAIYLRNTSNDYIFHIIYLFTLFTICALIKWVTLQFTLIFIFYKRQNMLKIAPILSQFFHIVMSLHIFTNNWIYMFITKCNTLFTLLHIITHLSNHSQ